MKTALSAILALGALAAINTTPAAARDYAFCLTGHDFAGSGHCRFDTLAQCEASASGRYAVCASNPNRNYDPGVFAAPAKRRDAR